MYSRILTIVLLTSSIALSGCATRTKMAFSEDAEKEIKTDKPVFLMTATLRNTYKTSYQPKLLVVNVEKIAGENDVDKINFVMDDKAKDESDSSLKGSNYLLRMELERGTYVIRGLTSLASSFPIHGFFFAPLHANLEPTKTGIFYIGHIEATVRERKGNEFKAGPSIPLIDQAIAGASTGTFDIEVTDQWEKDEPKFRAKFPVLNGITVEKAILLPFDRNKAQQWWEAN